jgi:pimeloyl-ACP methyl ester carboxylesterase
VSRDTASRQLAVALHASLEQWPAARHYVVGHSHGGGVALKALQRDAGLADRVAGVVTIATPFLSVRPLRLAGGPPLESLRLLWLLTLNAICLSLLSLPFFLIETKDGAPTLLIRVFSWLLAPGLVLSGFASAWLSDRLARWMIAVGERARAWFDCRPAAGMPLLVVRSTADEASLALAVAHLASWLIRRVWHVWVTLLAPALWLLRLVWRKGGPVATTFIVYVVLMGLSGALWISDIRRLAQEVDRLGQAIANQTRFVEQPEPSTLERVASAALFVVQEIPNQVESGNYGFALWNGCVAIAGMMVGAVWLLWPVLGLLGLCLLPFGPEAALTTPAWEVSVEPVPVGRWTVHHVTNRHGGRGLLSLSHSAYNEPRVVRAIAQWVLEKESGRGADAAPVRAATRDVSDA